MAFDLYRETMLGALEEMMESNKLSAELGMTVCKTFDASMLDALRNHVTGKALIKANLKTYRYLDGVWQFNLEKVSFKLSASGTGSMSNAPEVQCEKAKVVCVDATLAPEPPAANP